MQVVNSRASPSYASSSRPRRKIAFSFFILVILWFIFIRGSKQILFFFFCPVRTDPETHQTGRGVCNNIIITRLIVPNRSHLAFPVSRLLDLCLALHNYYVVDILYYGRVVVFMYVSTNGYQNHRKSVYIFIIFSAHSLIYNNALRR